MNRFSAEFLAKSEDSSTVPEAPEPTPQTQLFKLISQNLNKKLISSKVYSTSVAATSSTSKTPKDPKTKQVSPNFVRFRINRFDN